MTNEHISLYVQDLEKARGFFIRYFGAVSNDGYHNMTTDFRSYFLTFDGGARLEIMNRPGLLDAEKSPVRTGYAHVAFRVGSKSAVENLTERLRQDGYAILSGPRTTGDGYYESCVIALENNLIEITA